MRLARHWSGRRHDTTVLLLVLAALLCVPVPLGANRPHAWLLLELWVYALLAVWGAGAALYGEYRRIPTPAWAILAALVAWLGFVLLQTVPLPGRVVETLSPFAYSQQRNLELLNMNTRHTLSIDPGTTYNELLKYGSYVSIFFLLIATVTTRTRLLLGVGAVVVAGLLEAVFGIYCWATGFEIFPEMGGARAGTFVNRDHFSNFLFMTLAVVLGLLVSLVNAESGSREAGGLNGKKARVYVLGGAAVVFLTAISLSGSGAPVIAFIAAFLLMLAVGSSTGRLVKGEVRLGLIGVPVALAVIFLTGYDDHLGALLERGILDGEWMQQNLLGFNLLSVVWLTGVGAGNYRWAFTAFRDGDLRFVTYDQAHNDYLQTLVEQGVPGALLLGLAMVLMLRELYRGYRVRRNPLARGVIFGCMLGMIYMLLHAAGEFNFRIPANAVYFFALAALGIAACRIDRQRRTPRSTQHRNRESEDG